MGFDDDDHHLRKFGSRHKIVISAVFTLFALTIIVLCLHFFLRNRRRRRRESRITDFGEIHQISRVDVREDHTPETPKSGLNPLIIATVLPESVHKQSDNHGEAVECSICLSNIEEKASVRLLPNCKHIFHVDCVDMWLHSNTTCPTCRTAVEPRVPPTAPPLMAEQPGSLRTLSRERSEAVEPTAPPLREEEGSSRVGSLRRVLSRERSVRVQSCGDESVGSVDMERQ